MRKMTTTLVGLASAATIATSWSAGLTPRVPSAASVQVEAASAAGPVTADPPAAAPKRPARTGSSTASSPSSPSGKSSTRSGKSSKPAPAPAPKSGHVDGAVVSTRYGQVQVRVRFTGKTITAVTALHLTDSSGTSVAISRQAAPILRGEALAKQSAQIDMVSGATYTSEGYIQSLQSAIDAAHLA